MDEIRLIDANALQKKCIEGDGNDKFTEGYNFAVQEISAYIVLAPTIDAQPVKHGKWIPMDEYCAKCSVCGWWQKTNGKCCTGHANIHKAAYKYCTACGAKMDGDADEQ